MQFTIQREPLLKLLRAVSGVVERRVALNPILANIFIQIEDNRLTMVATDKEVALMDTIAVDAVDATGATTVQFRKLNELCKALPEQAQLTFNTQADRAYITAGRSRFSLSTLPDADFPMLSMQHAGDTAGHFEISKKLFRGLIERTAFAMANQDVRYFLNGMLLEVKDNHLYAVAADGHRLAMYKLSLNQEVAHPGMRVIVPRKGILEIMRALDNGPETLRLEIAERMIQVKVGNLVVTSRLLEGKFPDYERVIPRLGDKIVEGGRNCLKEAFLRASALFSDKFRGVRLRLSNNRLKVLAHDAEQDEAEEDLEVNYEGQELEIGFNVRYLIDFLSVVQGDRVRLTFSDSNHSALLEEVGEQKGFYVLMPMRM